MDLSPSDSKPCWWPQDTENQCPDRILHCWRPESHIFGLPQINPTEPGHGTRTRVSTACLRRGGRRGCTDGRSFTGVGPSFTS